MINNNGLFRRKKYSISRQKKRRDGRLFIRRSKIYKSNTLFPSNPNYNNFTINYRPQLRRKLFNGAGDEKIITPSSSIEQKHIDFTELEHIFDNAIRNRLPLELYKEKPQTKDVILTQHENFHEQSIPKLKSLINNNPIDTRIELSTAEPVEDIKYCFIHNIKQHKILSAVTFITLSALIGFFSVFIFIK